MTVAAEPISLPRLTDHGRVTQWRVVRSEWRKLISLRSTRWSLGVFVLLTIGLSALFAAVTSAHWGHMSPHDRADRHPLDIALAGVNLSQLAIGVLGVLVITGEYSTGMIRASLTAVPKRLPVLWAKLGVFAVGHVPAGAPVGADRVLRHPGDPLAPQHPPDLVLAPRRRSCGRRRGRLPDAARDLRAGARRDRPQHRRRDRRLRGDLLRDPTAAQHPADELEQRHLAVPPEQRGPLDLLVHPRRPQPRAGPGSRSSPATAPSRS